MRWISLLYSHLAHRAPGIELPERPQYNATADIAYWDEMEMSRSRSIFDVAEDFGGYERSPMRLAEKAYGTGTAGTRDSSALIARVPCSHRTCQPLIVGGACRGACRFRLEA